jgi:hypothetical protein
MKKYLIAFVFLCNLSFANAQLLNMMPDSNMKWREVAGWSGSSGSGGKTIIACNLFQFIGDTLIDSLIYKKLYLMHDTIDSITMYMGGVREDSLNIVHIFPWNFTEEIQFYNYNLNIGEEFRINIIGEDGSFIYNEQHRFYVKSKFTIDILNKNRRVIEFQHNVGSEDNLFWIEGIGSSYGLMYNKTTNGILRSLEEYLNIISLELNNNILLTCEDLKKIINTTCGLPCRDYYSTENIESAIFKTHIYPNPNSGSFTLQLESTTSTETQLRVFDSMGKMIYSDKLQTPQGKSNTEVQLDNVSKGIYLIQLNIGNEISNHRMVIK